MLADSSTTRLAACVSAGFLALSLHAMAQQDSVLVFNEVNYHPADGGSEWVELASTFGVDVDISDWALDGAVDYTFPEGTIMPGNGLLVVAADPGSVPGALGPFTGRLDDDGEELRLMNNSGRVMCILDYNDRGNWPVAPDGSGVTLAKRSVLALSSTGSSWHWSTAVGGNPGEPNFPEGIPAAPLVLNEVAGFNGDGFFVEVMAPDTVNLNGFKLVTSADETYEFPDQELEAGAFFGASAEMLGFENLEQGQRLYLQAADGSIADAAVLRGRGRSRFPDGGDWLISTEDSQGSANVVKLHDAIVINEIMYHHRPTYEGEGEGVTFQKNPEEWVELYNRSAAAMDLTGWAFDDGIRYEFPEGTMLEAGAYLVVARDAEALGAKFPGITILGDYNGNLTNDSDHLVLADAAGNPADEVRYYEGGSWPGRADAGGSSLELLNPNSDNSKPGSWAASDEGSRSEWQTHTYRGVAERPPGTNFPTQWKEFNMGLLDAGEFLIDDVSVIEDPDGAATNLIRNRSFSKSIFGGDGSQNWRFRGNQGGHGKTVIVNDPTDEENTVLHVLATGATEHMHNQIETTLSGNATVAVGTEYEISFRAKWLGGSPQLHTRLYFNYLAHKTILAIPTKHGTPGAANSTFEENPGPAYVGLTHSPGVPADQEPISITVDATDPDGIESIVVKWRTTPDGDFDSLPMALVDGERYEGVLPGQPAKNLFGAFNETVIQYYLEGKDTAGNVTWWPANGPESRALIPLDDGRQGDTPGHNLRIVMLEPDIDFLHETTNVMSNHRMPCTVIDREEHVYYNVGVRLKGSERGRNQNVRVGFSLKMPRDQPFHGVHGTVAVDRSGAGNQFSQKEMLVKHAINRLGDIPGMYDDLIYIISPRATHEGSAMFLKARYDREYLDAQFENGTDGRMFEYELIYFPTTSEGGSEGLKRPEPDAVRGVGHRNLGPDKETYRWHYLLENNRDADDYTQMMDMLDLFGSPADDVYFERLWNTIDVHQWMRAFAIQQLFGIGDNYSSGSQHNMIMYFPPNGKAMYFPWDMDFTFSGGATSAFPPNHGDMGKMLRDPRAFRSYYAQTNEMLEKVVNKDYMERWTTHYSTFLPSENLGNFANYIDQRNRKASSELRSKFEQVTFAITSMDGNDFEVAASTVTLQGKGWFNVAEVRINDTLYELDWIDRDVWELTLPLALGENKFDIQALDVLGTVGSIFSPVGKASITITNTGAGASANASNVAISEIMYHPAAPSEAEIAAGFVNQDDFEFIELQNVSDEPVDMAGARFTRGIDFDFPNDVVLPAGGYLVLATNPDAFKVRYGDIAVAGAYDGQLRNSGESLRLKAVDDSVIQQFSYNDAEPWPISADGEGPSLVAVAGAEDPDSDESWTASAVDGGSPGSGESAPEPNAAFEAWLAARGGDALADPDGDGLSLLAEYGLGLDLGGGVPNARATGGTAELVFHRRTTDGVSVSVQTSNDLVIWKAASAAGTSSDLGNGLTEVVIPISDNYARLQLTP